jgi:LPXTG-motif cell wall-anchored protein
MRFIGAAALTAGMGLAALGMAGPALATESPARGAASLDCDSTWSHHKHSHHWWQTHCKHPKGGVHTGGGGASEAVNPLLTASGLSAVALGGGLAIVARRRRRDSEA